MQILLIAMVIVGAILLFISLFPTFKICNDQEVHSSVGWKFLGVLIILFIAGYGLFCFTSLSDTISTSAWVVPLILLGGGIFVILVVRLSLNSILHVKHLAEKERHRALHDELTELPNRILLQDRIDQAIKSSKRQNTPVTILLMDLNKFKEINDALGHFYGDYVLQQIAVKLGGAIRESDTLARFGGDEFVIVLPGANIQQAINICHKIAGVLETPLMIEGHKLTIGISIGITICPDHGTDSETLIQRADVAMYFAKKNEILYSVFNPEHDQATWDRLVKIGELQEAIPKGELILHYQPKVSFKTGKLCGVEVLVRWRHPEHGILPPDEFIFLAEQSGLINKLTAWVVEKAMQQVEQWIRKGYRFSVSINLSVINLHDMEFPQKLDELFNTYHIDPSLIIFEITENSMMRDPERVKVIVQKLIDLGVNLSIDDYGTGYSSLAYLRKFPAKEIKIDKSYIMDMLHNEDNAIIVKSTIDMVHNIGRKVVAEGVEDRETMEYLESMNCDYQQGFHICKPLSLEEFHHWLSETHWHNA